jgi:hypothetical protein
LKHLTRTWRLIAVALACWLMAGSAFVEAVHADSVDVLLFREGEDTLSVLGHTIYGIGDINGDGFDDVAIASNQPKGIYVYQGGNPADTIPAYFLRGGPNIASGADMTGDGIPDLVVQATEDRLLLYRGFGDSIESVPSDSIAPSFATYSYGSYVTSGLVSGDSIGDLTLVDPYYPGGGRAYYYENPFVGDKEPDWTFTNQALSHSTRTTGFIEFDGDGIPDIVLSHRADLDSISMVYIFKGPVFNSAPDIVLGVPIELDSLGLQRDSYGAYAVNVSDISGDGWDDLAVEYSNRQLLYYGGPAYDTVYDMLLESKGGGWPTVAAGDVNGDGWDDLMCGQTQTWSGAVDVFLGGARFDSVSDFTILEHDFRPYPRHSIGSVGHNVASAGDFNGDGFDDLLIHHRDNECCNWEFSSVYVLAGGPHIVMGIEETRQASLPEAIALSQNYPNPFNSTTTISFDIPVRQKVKLRIFNIVGREVITLLDQVESAGRHTISWNGVDGQGKEVASGIYLYVLTNVDYVRSMKMLLLK